MLCRRRLTIILRPIRILCLLLAETHTLPGTITYAYICEYFPGGIHDILVVCFADEAVDDGIADVVQSVDVVQKVGSTECDTGMQSGVAKYKEGGNTDRELQHFLRKCRLLSVHIIVVLCVDISVITIEYTLYVLVTKY